MIIKIIEQGEEVFSMKFEARPNADYIRELIRVTREFLYDRPKEASEVPHSFLGLGGPAKPLHSMHE